jgi:hypothetical protein
VKVVVHLSALDRAGNITARSDAVVSLVQIKMEDLGLQRFQGLFTDALCNGVYITPSSRASDYGRLGVVFVFVPLTHGTNATSEPSVNGHQELP